MITRNGKLYVATPCDPPTSGEACGVCDLYNPKGRAGMNRCRKGAGKPHCVPSRRSDRKWKVFKEVV